MRVGADMSLVKVLRLLMLVRAHLQQALQSSTSIVDEPVRNDPAGRSFRPHSVPLPPGVRSR